MKYDKNPLTPHLQIYKWQISSLLSITHRIVGVINFIVLTLICFLIIFLINNENNFDLFKFVIETSFGKFILISLSWTFSFQILNEVRHFFWDLGYGYDLRISKITGLLTIIGSFILAVLIYLIGKGIS
tara:strand:+ start:2423 stop:2809 length:387 start_codon:yes stop_codon:yes gene_type:complete